MTEPTAEKLATAYRDFRLRLTKLARTLDPATAATKTPTCPEWSSKNLLAHEVAPGIAFQFYLDAFTHEWDVRQAVGAEPSAPDYSLIAHAIPPLIDLATGGDWVDGFVVWTANAEEILDPVAG